MSNEFDNEHFFNQYAMMPRSKEGLSAAGEWHQLKPLFPPLQEKSFLDLGCGYGWHCKFAEEQDASRLEAVEEARPSKEMMDIPGMKDELRRPMMLLVKAKAKK